jgi:hypothetical protein
MEAELAPTAPRRTGEPAPRSLLALGGRTTSQVLGSRIAVCRTHSTALGHRAEDPTGQGCRHGWWLDFRPDLRLAIRGEFSKAKISEPQNI